ncbi:DUF1772 domain-containing protein [Aliiglaciecola sp. M165]|uniref:anthrone oxygenase family protein n=1 Tax=Aliiglaciecola sp. M165 TaxID=2593649 RepID=UPI00117EE10E|nr:anthrone oxygenase family protein [Aliiglaciecola sp. M165]TRY29818.1 DUF1772 domain-containing protein [Aliiglaciecola sp. M165]
MTGITILTLIEALLQLSMIVMVGLYFVFSNTVMGALSQRTDGASTMVEINKQILNPTFLVCFAVSGLAGLYFFLFHCGFLSLAGIIFFTGTTLVTALFNVPLNNQLLDATGESLGTVWQKYLDKWVFWNHVRTASAVLSSLLLFI